MAQDESVTCSLILSGVHGCDITAVLRNTQWADWYQNASAMHDDFDQELIVTLKLQTLQEVQEILHLTREIRCVFGRQLCTNAKTEEKNTQTIVADKGFGWQELSASFN